jgi:murein L,D-transpeptidase YafK
MRLLTARVLVCLSTMATTLVYSNEPPALVANPVNRVIVGKSERRLYLLADGWVVRSYRIALGHEPSGPKVCEGDLRTPEGSYIIEKHVANSRFHLALRISYPNDNDRYAASGAGCRTGGDIMIHGLPEKYAQVGRNRVRTDWTDGCIAVTNEEIEEIFAMVADGTPIEIRD